MLCIVPWSLYPNTARFDIVNVSTLSRVWEHHSIHVLVFCFGFNNVLQTKGVWAAIKCCRLDRHIRQWAAEGKFRDRFLKKKIFYLACESCWWLLAGTLWSVCPPLGHSIPYAWAGPGATRVRGPEKRGRLLPTSSSHWLGCLLHWLHAQPSARESRAIWSVV